MSYEIVCTRGPMKGRRWKVTPNGLKIGRDKSCEIQVDDLSAELDPNDTSRTSTSAPLRSVLSCLTQTASRG